MKSLEELYDESASEDDLAKIAGGECSTNTCRASYCCYTINFQCE